MSIFKEPFSKEIEDSLNIRQTIAGKENRTPQELTFINSNTSWVKFASSVNVNGSPDLASQNVLTGGTLFNGNQRFGVGAESSNAYSLKNTKGENNILGIKPMPGITSVEIHNKGAYGSLRQATVNFQCWDIKQLEILETLYMRPGYTVLLEFGRNTYFENGKINPIRYKDDFFTQQNVDLHSYLNDLHKRAVDSKGHYDSLFGYITNYAWNARGDGGYDCKTEIISTGEILESLKVNYSVGLVDFTSLVGALATPTSGSTVSASVDPSINATKANLPKFTGLLHDPVNLYNGGNIKYERLISYNRINEEYSQNILSGLIYETFRLCSIASGVSAAAPVINAGAGNVKSPDGTTKPLYSSPNTVDSLKFYEKTIGPSIVSSNSRNIDYAIIDYVSNNEDPDYKIIKSDILSSDVYITLESFVELLNTYIIAVNPSNSNSPLTSLSVKDRGYLGKGNEPLYCLYNTLMTSVDPDVCLIKNDAWLSILSNIKIDTNWVEPTSQEVGKVTGFDFKQTMVNNVVNILEAIGKGGKDKGFFSSLDQEKKILQLIENQGLSSGMSFAEFGKSFNEHYVKVRGGFESSNNTYRFPLYNTNSLTQKQFESIEASQLKFFRNVWSYYFDEMTNNAPIFKDIPFAQAVYSYNTNNQSTQDLDKFVNQDQKLTEDLLKTNQQKNELISAVGSSGRWWQEKVFSRLKKDFIKVSGDHRFGNIGSIYLNTKFLYKMAKDPSLRQQDPSGKNSLLLLNYLKAVLQEVQISLGNVNNFEIHIDDRDGIGRIIDLNYVNLNKDNKPFTFEIGSNKSIVKDLKLESQIFANQASMIAISAQSDAGSYGLDNSTLVSYNAGITDRVIPKKDSPIYSLGGAITNKGVQINGFTSALSVIAKFFNTFKGDVNTNTPGRFEAKDSIANKDALKEIINFFTSIKSTGNKNKSFLPTKISLTLDGLSGFIIGNLFNVDKTFLPQSYKGTINGVDVGYIIVNVAHSINNNMWDTTLEGYPFVIPAIDTPDQEDYDLKLIVDYDPLTNEKTVYIDNLKNERVKGSLRSAYNKAEMQDPGFQEKVREVAKAIGTTETDLITVMRAESGLDSTIINKDGGAVGLIQFFPTTSGGNEYKINGKVYTREQIRSMGRIKQMDLVRDYFYSWNFKGQKQIGIFELYGVTFYPYMIKKNKPDDFILGSQISSDSAFAVAKQNSGIAKFGNRQIDGKPVIDVATFKKYLLNRMSSL
jgi:hypothetical protein